MLVRRATKHESVILVTPIDGVLGGWDGTMNGRIVKCCVVPPAYTVTTAGRKIIIEPEGYTQREINEMMKSDDVDSLSHSELLVAHKMLRQELARVLNQSNSLTVCAIRTELEQIERELESLAKFWCLLYDSNELESYSLTQFEKDNMEKVTTPYISLATDTGDPEKPVPHQLLELAKGKREIALHPAKKMRVHPLICPVYNLNSVTSADLGLLGSRSFNVLLKDREIRVEAERETYLSSLIIHMFHNLGLVSQFNIPEDRLFRFISTVCRKYRDVPFHCWYHAFNVTQTMYFFLTTCNIKKIFGTSKLEMLSMMVACVTHDTDHPGLNNMFQKKANSKLAQIYPTSILEHHHLMQAMLILSRPECDILMNISAKEKKKFFDYLKRLILATDLAFHKTILEDLEPQKQAIKRNFLADPLGPPTVSLTYEQTLVAMKIVMKCADLSNEIRESVISLSWAHRINHEFFKQHDMEKTLGLPVTPFMDPDKIKMAQEQVNFISGLCAPLYGALLDCFPSVQECITQMEMNRHSWEAQLSYVDKVEKMKAPQQTAWMDTEAVPEVPHHQSGKKGHLSDKKKKQVVKKGDDKKHKKKVSVTHSFFGSQ